jgi:hypothetical protein
MKTRQYKTSADIIVTIHFFWTFFLLIGAVAMLFYPPYAWIQLYAMSFTLLIAIPFGNICPLTLLEERLRRKFDRNYHNDGSYIATYFNKIFRTNVSTTLVNETAAGCYVIAYGLAIALLILQGYGFLSR